MNLQEKWYEQQRPAGGGGGEGLAARETDSLDLEQLAIPLYSTILRVLPASARAWYGGVRSKQLAQAVEVRRPSWRKDSVTKRRERYLREKERQGRDGTTSVKKGWKGRGGRMLRGEEGRKLGIGM